jgi:GAF domain-containing protein
MDPIPETAQAAEDLAGATGETGLLDELCGLVEQAQVFVPDLVGVSVARLQAGLTFTLVASDEDVTVLDAVQYVAGGPCVEGARSGKPQETRQGDDAAPLDEEGWRMFSAASAARAVRSTLTMPILDEGGVAVGSVNLYGGSARAFVDVREQLAELFGAWAAGAVANADLSFATRLEAQAAPGRIRDQATLSEAVDVIGREQGVGRDLAEQRLRTAAALAGVDLVQLARQILEMDHRGDRPGEGEADE